MTYRWTVNDDLIGPKKGGMARGRKSTSYALRLALSSSQRQPSPEEPPNREGPTASAACKFGFLDLEVITGPKLFNVVVSTRANRLEGITIPRHVPQWERKRDASPHPIENYFYLEPSPAAAMRNGAHASGQFAALSSSRPRRPSQRRRWKRKGGCRARGDGGRRDFNFFLSAQISVLYGLYHVATASMRANAED